MKKILATALAFALTLGTFALPAVESGVCLADKLAVSASAETYGDYEYEILDDGTVEISKYKGSDSTVTIPKNIDENEVASIGRFAFDSCKSITSVDIPNSVKTIDKSAFFGCTNLESIIIPNSVININDSAFLNCVVLKNVTIPYGVKSIGASAFSYCKSLKTITIPDSVTSIDYGAFYECTSLTSVTIPNSITCIYFDVFKYCNNLKNIYYTGTESEWRNISIANGNDPIDKATIHYNWVDNTKEKLSSCTISLPTATQYFRGTRIKPVVTVKNGSETLKSGTDYKAVYSNNLSVGTATVTIIGIGKYTGSVTKTYDIIQRSINNCDVMLDSDIYSFNGIRIKPSVKVYCNGTEMYNGNYTVAYSNNLSAGTATITLTGKKNLKGTVTKTFKINPRNIGNCTVELTKNSANKYQPTVAVKIGSNTIYNGNYTVKYVTSADKKTVKVTLTGKGNLAGTITKTYTVA